MKVYPTVRCFGTAAVESIAYNSRLARSEKGFAMSAPAPTASTRQRPADILLVDPHPISRTGVVAVLRELSGTGVPREVETAAAGLSAIAVARPDLVIVELNLNGPSGLDYIRRLIALHPRLVVLVFSSCPEEWYADRALRAGARGYVMKSAPPAVLREAVSQVMAGRLFVSPRVAELVVSRLAAQDPRREDPMSSLSDREMEVFLLIGEAFGTAEIARRLRVSVSSVESYRAGIKRKLGLANCAQLVRAAVSRAVSGVGSPPPPPPHTHTLSLSLSLSLPHP